SEMDNRPHSRRSRHRRGKRITSDALPEPASRPALEAGDTLATLLQRAFGFSSFRPNQEAVCRAAIENAAPGLSVFGCVIGSLNGDFLHGIHARLNGGLILGVDAV